MKKIITPVILLTSLTSLPASGDIDELGMQLADGYKATIFADNLGRARHIVVRDNGDVYVAMRGDKGVMALRDTDSDGIADITTEIENEAETGIGIYKDYLYYSSNSTVYRVKFADGELLPAGESETIVSGFPSQRQHAAKPFTFDDDGHIYVNVGAPSNACQEKPRSKGAAGLDPCPQLERQASIWRFDAETADQTQEADGHKYVSGLRNAVALDWHPDGGLHLVQHGRDQLGTLWPDYYSIEDSAELPAEEFHAVYDGANLGWPYTYFDPEARKRMTAPEYGGDGKTEAPKGKYQTPIHAFPAHWAPNDLIFTRTGAFSPTMKGGAFIAFHGSWNRAPLPQQGFRVQFVHFKIGEKMGDPIDIAWGFQGDDDLVDTRKSNYRPMGLAEGPDGALYISDSMKGRIWKITKSD